MRRSRIGVKRILSFLLLAGLCIEHIYGRNNRPTYVEMDGYVTPKDDGNRGAIKKNPVTFICGTESTAICGFLQLNDRGANEQQLCNCPNPFNPCKLGWNPDDGYSVTQGSEQYKFCGRAPRLQLCPPYTSAFVTRLTLNTSDNNAVLNTQNQMLCVCPPTHTYFEVNRRFESNYYGVDIVHLTYICTKLQPCLREEDVCKTVSQSANHYLVNTRCMCPGRLVCPTEPTKKARTIVMDEGRGTFTKIRCQLP